MFEPTNEAETVELYKLMQEKLGWRIIHLQTAFPDAVIENARGQRLVVEFEYRAKSFRIHGHDPAGCDLVICWTNGWADAPVPVWALEDCVPALLPKWFKWAKWITDALKRWQKESIQKSMWHTDGSVSVPEVEVVRKRYVCYVSDKKAELQDWLDRQPNISAVIVAALEMYKARQEGKAETPPLDTEAIRQILREELALVSITNGASGPDRAEGDEDPDVTQGMGILAGTYDFGDDESEPG